MLENDEDPEDYDLNEDDLEEALASDPGEPLVSRGRRRRRRKWDEDEENKDRSLFEVGRHSPLRYESSRNSSSLP
jgi:hypothetical protein